MRRNSLGFSLVELVTVIIIVGILSAIAAPRFANISIFTSNSFFQDALNSVRYAQQLAVGMGCEIRVSLTSSTISLVARSGCTTGGFSQQIRDPSFGQTSYSKSAPSGVTITNTNFPIYFDALGRAKDASSGAVTDATVTINSRTIQIVGETGYTYEV